MSCRGGCSRGCDGRGCSARIGKAAGSVDSLNVSSRFGFRPKALQMREMAVRDTPIALAMDRVDQCVASVGRSSGVLVITASTFSSVIRRGRPGRGLSRRPCRRMTANRLRHFATVTPVQAQILGHGAEGSKVGHGLRW
jgi:hypothetical protein